MLRSSAACVAICAAIAGCAAPHPAPTPAPLMVRVPCLGPDVPDPRLGFGQGAYPGDTSAIAEAWRDIQTLRQHARDLRARAAGCR